MCNRSIQKSIFKTGARQMVLAAVLLAGVVLIGARSAIAEPAWANAFNDPNARVPGAPAGGGGSDLVPVSPNVDGGKISVGSTAQVVILFRNDSGHPLQVGAIQLYPSSTVSADITSNQCAQEDLPAASVCAVSIAVKALQSGAWRVEMLVRHNGRARLTAASSSGTVQTGEGSNASFINDVQALPDKLDFGDIITSQSVVKGVVLRNTTTEAIDVNSVYVEAADKAGFSVKTDCAHLMSGQACMAVVTWSPVLSGQVSGLLVVDHTGHTKVTSIEMIGKYSPTKSVEAETFPEAVPGKGLLVASQKDVDFGSGIDTTSAVTVSLVNVGDAPLTISDIRLANEQDGLSIGKSGCAAGTLLQPVEACPLTLSWSPVREGAILDDVQVIHDGTRGVLVLPVKGAATGAISQDSKAVKLVGGTAGTLAPGASAASKARGSNIDPASILDGFTVTSHAAKRAIISGPGGSRIVSDGQQIVLGGFVWNVKIRPSGVEFNNASEKVLLLFDRSLSAGRAPAGAAGAAASPSAPASSSAPAPAPAPSPSASAAGALTRSASR